MNLSCTGNVVLFNVISLHVCVWWCVVQFSDRCVQKVYIVISYHLWSAIKKYKDQDIQNCKFVFSYVSEASLTLREENSLMVLGNGVLRKLFGPKKDEVTGDCRRLHNEELYAPYSSPNVIRMIKSRRMRWTGQVARMGDTGGAYRDLMGRPEGRRPFERPRRIC